MRLIRVLLGEIQRRHTAIDAVIDRLSVSPMRTVPRRLVEAECLINLLTLHPIRIVKIEGGYACSGNVRIWHLAADNLDPTVPVTCVLEDDLGQKEEESLIRRTINELIYLPALLGIRSRETAVLYQGYLYDISVECGPPRRPKSNRFAKLYGVDPRSLADVSRRVQGGGAQRLARERPKENFRVDPVTGRQSLVRELSVQIRESSSSSVCSLLIPYPEVERAAWDRFERAREALRMRILANNLGRPVSEQLESYLKQVHRFRGRPHKLVFADAVQPAVVVDDATLAALLVGAESPLGGYESDAPRMVVDAVLLEEAVHIVRQVASNAMFHGASVETTPIERLISDVATLVEPLLILIPAKVRALISDPLNSDDEPSAAAALARGLILPLWTNYPSRYRNKRQLQFWPPPGKQAEPHVK